MIGPSLTVTVFGNGAARYRANSAKLPSLRAAALTILLFGTSINYCAAQAPGAVSRPAAHVYLLRGAFNIFSLGLDQIAARLEQLGIATTVTNYLDWPNLAREASADYQSGRLATIILVGHSSGAVAVTEMAARLSQLGIPVKLAIGLDPSSRVAATGNIDLYLNYYVPGGMGTVVDRGVYFNGTLQNIDVESASVDHFNIDKNSSLQDRVIENIRASLSSSSLDGMKTPTKRKNTTKRNAARKEKS